jgi:hypothetical protein
MVWRLLPTFLSVFLLFNPALADENYFFEVGPRYTISLGDNPIARYWDNGLGIGGSLGFFLDDNLAMVYGFSYATMSPNGKAPSIYRFIQADGPVRLAEDQRAFGDRSSVLMGDLHLRMYRRADPKACPRNFFTVGLSYMKEDIGDLILLLEDYANPGNYTAYSWSGEDYSGEYIVFSIGGGLEIPSLWHVPMVFEALFHFPFAQEGSPSAYVPIQASFLF